MNTADDHFPRGSAEPPRWTHATSVPALAATSSEDAALLADTFQVRRLPAHHPVRVLWELSSSAARFRLQNLADDLRIVRHVEGAQSLIRQLRNNLACFEDFRFELRLAAALARSPGQVLLRLGGDRAGPDIEAILRSGHRCGFACYRASSEAPAIRQLLGSTRALAQGFSSTVLGGDVFDQLIAITFPRFPLGPEDDRRVRTLLRQLTRNLDVPILEDDGFRVGRYILPACDRPRGDVGRIRLRLQFPVPSWEEQRVSEAVLAKAEREASSWARGYPGVPAFALEESLFGCGMIDRVSDVVDNGHVFKAIVSFFPAVLPHDSGVHHGFDDIGWLFATTPIDSTEPPRRLDIGLETFGDNTVSWGADHAVGRYTEHTLSEDWDIARSLHGPSLTRTQPLQLYRGMARVPCTPGVEPGSDPALLERLAEAVCRIRDLRTGATHALP